MRVSSRSSLPISMILAPMTGIPGRSEVASEAEQIETQKVMEAGHPFHAGSSSVPGGLPGVAGDPGGLIWSQVCTQLCPQHLLILVHPLPCRGLLLSLSL